MTGTRSRRTFPSTPASAGEARRFVESALAAVDLDHLAFAATMLVSELVANAVLHTGTPIEVVISPEPDGVRIEVHDGSPLLPIRKHYSTMSGTGRGLLLVERMAAEWGSERKNDGGKMVWFELDTTSNRALNLFDLEAL